MAATSKPRGRYSVGIATRAKIIDAAVRHFARYGYTRSSLAGLAREVGISEAGVLHHFSSKSELLLEVLRHNEELDRQAMVAAGMPATPLAHVDVISWCVDRNVERPGIVALFVVLSAEAIADDHPAHAWFAQRYDRLTGLLSDSLRAGITAGAIRADIDSLAVARELVAASDGLQIQWLLSGQAFDLPAAYRAAADRILAGITAG
ncbi:MAG: TetR/AcrR family transcriptional regulator [Micromonosporaceae bacterium]|nr:TetR/AcrR family transcriptional regulator [Micromonosporaceae bacterium]